jgi:hypothetical protein
MIWNKGNLVTANLLLGGTKDIQNSAEIIGRFGEGMKLSALSLIRENSTRNKRDNETQLNIYTCGKIWRFKIEKDVGFTRNGGMAQLCLHWCSEDYPKDEYKDKVVFEIIGISENEWRDEQDNYLWLTHRKTGSIIVLDDNKKIAGEILCEEFFLRKLYVKEVFINDTGTARDMTSYFGFNLDIDLDRDRNSVKNLAQRNKQISKILSIVLNKLEDYKREQEVDRRWLDNYPKEIYKLLTQGYNLVYTSMKIFILKTHVMKFIKFGSKIMEKFILSTIHLKYKLKIFKEFIDFLKTFIHIQMLWVGFRTQF